MTAERDTTREDSVIAAELVLGLLEGDARADALRRTLADRAFAAEVAFWREQVEPLYDKFDEAAPAPDLWQRIDSALPVQQSASPEPTRIDASSSFRWKLATIASSAVAAALALALLLPRGLETQSAPQGNEAYVVAQLSGEIEGLLLTARYDPRDSRLLVRVEGMPETETQPEIWIVGADGQPRSLGQIGRSGVTIVDVAKVAPGLVVPNAVMMLTMEPGSDKPHATPSADPVARGVLQTV